MKNSKLVLIIKRVNPFRGLFICNFDAKGFNLKNRMLLWKIFSTCPDVKVSNYKGIMPFVDSRGSLIELIVKNVFSFLHC